MSARSSSLLALLLAACAADHSIASATETIVRSSSASLAIDERGLYWLDDARQAVLHAPLGGGTAEPIVVAHPSLYAPIALVPDGIVWGDRQDGHVRVIRAARDGRDRTVVADGNGGPIGIGVDGGRIFFSREEGTFDLLEVDLATERERIVAPDLPALGIAIDGSDLIVTRCTSGGLVRVPRSGGAPRSIASTYCPIALVLDEVSIYFTDYADPSDPGAGGLGLFVVDARGGVPRRLAVIDSLAFAVHRARAYAAIDGCIVRIDPDGTRTQLSRATNVRGIAVDDELVYWTEVDANDASQLIATPHGE